MPATHDHIARAWQLRCRLVQTLAPSRHLAIECADAERADGARALSAGEARVGALESEIVEGHAVTIAGLAAQACLLSEFCELGTRRDDGDLVLARKLAAALVSLASRNGGRGLPEI